MGNFHCVTGGCGKVLYQEYLPPIVRWQYEDEAWEEVEGDDYSITQEPLETDDEEEDERYYYRVVGTFKANGDFSRSLKNGDEFKAAGNIYYASPIYSVELGLNGNLVGFIVDKTSSRSGDCSREKSGVNEARAYVDGFFQNVVTGESRGGSIGVDIDKPFSFTLQRHPSADFNLPKCTDISKSYVFKVFKEEVEVYSETRDIAPDVEKVDCRLSESYKQVSIDKFPYLERIEVVSYEYRNYFGLLPLKEGGLTVYQGDIPEECLNIYKNDTVTIIPQSENIGTPGNSAQSTYGYISQICSAPGCPPPQYEVICDCSCQECPPDTCSIVCEQVVCCHNKSTGKLVKEIPLHEYCGGS